MSTTERHYRDYKHIAAWGRFMGSFAEYIEDEQRRAADSDAPLNAVYQNADGTWETINGVTDAGVKRIIDNFMNPSVDEE